MIATIEQVWRRVMQRPLVPLALLVMVVRVPADPTRRTTGYGGRAARAGDERRHDLHRAR